MSRTPELAQVTSFQEPKGEVETCSDPSGLHGNPLSRFQDLKDCDAHIQHTQHIDNVWMLYKSFLNFHFPFLCQTEKLCQNLSVWAAARHRGPGPRRPRRAAPRRRRRRPPRADGPNPPPRCACEVCGLRVEKRPGNKKQTNKKTISAIFN